MDINLDKIGNLEYGLHDDMYYGGRVAFLKVPGMSGRVSIFIEGIRSASEACKINP